jgi:hypothetical protein
VRPQLPPDMAAQLRTVAIDQPALDRLATVYHRNVARTLAAAFSGVNGAPAARRVSWNEPRTVCRALTLSGNPLLPAEEPGLLRALEGRVVPPPRTRVLRGAELPHWVEYGLERAAEALNYGGMSVMRAVLDPSAALLDSYRRAQEAVALCWPAASQETQTLIREVVFVEGPMRSSTEPCTFGAIYVGIDEASSPLRLFEVLLHETGHHSLSLRENFTSYLRNPKELGAHPLRQDPRPLRGVLHAAFVLARMLTGLTRYGALFPDGDGPLGDCDIAARVAYTAEALRAVLELLADKADWTEDGAALAESLHAVLAATREQELVP